MATQYVPILDPRKSGQRSSARVRLGISARLETLTGTYGCVVCDISTGGAHVRGHALKAGQSAVLLIEGREIFCDVAWAHDTDAGLMFVPPVEHDYVVKLRRDTPQIFQRDLHQTEVFARNWVRGFSSES